MRGARRRHAALVLSLATTAGLGAAQPTFKSRVEAVRVDVLVTEHRRPLLGLRTDDFEVRDNGVLQEVEHARFEQVPLNLVLALDTSDSVRGERLEHLLEASGALIDSLEPDDETALVTFGHELVLRSELTADRASIRAALADVRARGDTSLIDAAYGGLIAGEAGVGRGLLLVFSDGLDVTSFLAPDEVLDIARRSDIVAYGVTVRSVATPEFLNDLGDATGGDVVEVESTRDLRRTFLSILEEFRHRYLLSYSPRGVSPGGWHTLEVKVKRRGAAVRARPGYLRDAPP